VACAYCRLIGQWHSFASTVDEADLVILHCEPHDYASLYRSYALAHKYVVSCAVWEATELSDAYKRSLELVQEIWVPSQYCKAAFERCHARVNVVPYVLDREAVSSDLDRSAVRQMIGYDRRHIYYLTVTKIWDRRKNVQLLIDTFESLRAEMPEARLLVKAYVYDDQPRVSDVRIIVINANLTDPQISALYECADVYVSAHHSEGWGLTIADALLLQKPTIATRYSGKRGTYS
jgi:glycosyltransferase involved in cell wall biosynthesis